jgi:hypothetical protein
VQLGDREKKVPSLEFCSRTTGGQKIFVVAFYCFKGWFGFYTEVLVSEFLVHLVVNSPEPFRQGICRLESGGEWIFFHVLGQTCATEFTGENKREHAE